MGGSLELAFAAGLLATVNPCGFALLPAYLAYYLGLTDDTPDPTGTPAVRAVGVGAALTAGFVAVFGAIGVVWSAVSSVVGSRLPWLTMLMGVAVIGLGIAMVAGRQPVARIPKMQTGAGGQEAWSMFLFGVSYAVASLSCTLPIFIGTMTAAFGRGFFDGLTTFGAFTAGMGVLTTALTVTVAYARRGLVTALRGILPRVGRISGVLLIITGCVAVAYGWSETRALRTTVDGPASGSGFALWLTNRQADLSDWITRVGPLRLGAACLAAVLAVVGIGALIGNRRSFGRVPD